MNRELTDALVELAESTHTNTASIKTRGVHVEQIRDIETNRPRSLRNAVLATLLTLVAFAAGIYSARYFPVRQNGASDVADATKTEGNGDQVVLKQEIPVNPDPDDIETITGTITYVDSNGADKPDSQALVLLLPTTNAANLLLPAAPLRDLEPTSARSAIESALGVLGVTTTRANDQGQFRLPRKTTTAGVLIVISRHAARPDGQSPDPEVQSALAKWFDSPTQLLGRLSAQARPLSAFIKDSLVPPCEIKFTPAK